MVVTWPLTLMETPKSRGFSMPSFMQLFKATAPLFVAIFLFNVIENTPKFVMEGSLAYENQLYYNALYFPAQMILIGAQLVYKPLLLRMTGVWQDASKRKKFDLLIVGLMAVIVGITAAVWLVMAWVGVPVMSFLYGIDFEPYRGLLFVMLACGGVTAAIDFLYQVITVMRRQRDVTTLYLVTFGFSLFVPLLLVSFAGLDGAVLSYLIVESILLVLLVWEYFRIRADLARGGRGNTPEQSMMATTRSTERTVFLEQGGDDEPGETEADSEGQCKGWDPDRALPTPHKKRPSELRAEREHRQEVMEKMACALTDRSKVMPGGRSHWGGSGSAEAAGATAGKSTAGVAAGTDVQAAQRTQLRTASIAVAFLVAAVAGRVLFAGVPNVQPVTALCIVAGMVCGRRWT